MYVTPQASQTETRRTTIVRLHSANLPDFYTSKLGDAPFLPLTPYRYISLLQAGRCLRCGSVSFPSVVPIQVPTTHLTPKINISC